MKSQMKLFPLLACSAFAATSSAVQAAPPVGPGDRVAIVGNTFADQLRMHGYLETSLLLAYPEDPVSVRNLGWAGDMLTARDRPTNFPTEESMLKDHKTDVLIACFGMGESFAGESGLSDFRQDLIDFLNSHQGKSYNEESEVRLVLVGPIAYENHGSLTPRWEERNAELRAYNQVMSAVAAERDLPFVNLTSACAELMEDEELPDLTENGVTLNAFGYWSLADESAAVLGGGRPEWRLRVEGGEIGDCEGVRCRVVEGGAKKLVFSVEELSAPSFPPAKDLQELAPLSKRMDQLSVSGLESGDYSLSVDGVEVVIASAAEWEKGVPLINTPAHKELEAYRQAVNEKNLQFVYGWKALNQVHIVGERKSSPSGRALPGEIIEFYRIARELDAELRKGFPLKTRTWTLEPTK